MINRYKHTKKSLSILLLFTIITISLIPVAVIWGKSSKANNNAQKEETINFDLYLDKRCTIKVTSISWGEISPGGSSNAEIYIKNRSKIPMKLSCSLSNFSPDDANEYLSIDWDREGYILAERSTVKACLTLSISDSAKFSSFNVDVVISGTA